MGGKEKGNARDCNPQRQPCCYVWEHWESTMWHAPKVSCSTSVRVASLIEARQPATIASRLRPTSSRGRVMYPCHTSSLSHKATYGKCWVCVPPVSSRLVWASDRYVPSGGLDFRPSSLWPIRKKHDNYLSPVKTVGSRGPYRVWAAQPISLTQYEPPPGLTEILLAIAERF